MLLMRNALDDVNALLETTRLLEVEFGCRLLHLLRDLFDELSMMTCEETLNTRNVTRIADGVNKTAAGSRSESHVAVEAGFTLRRKTGIII